MEPIQKLEERVSNLEKQVSDRDTQISELRKGVLHLNEMKELHYKQISNLIKLDLLRSKDTTKIFKNFSTIRKWMSLVGEQLDATSLESIDDHLEEIADLKRDEHDARYKREHNL